MSLNMELPGEVVHPADVRHNAADAMDRRYTRSALQLAMRSIQSYIGLPLLYEHWYVAGLSSEFSRGLVAKTLLNRSIVFFRKEDGQVVALQNRCAHRSYPLSESLLEGDTIKCGYHGIRYDAEGRILNVPCQKNVPISGLRRYDVQEAGPLVWIWMGTGPGDLSKLPDMTAYTGGTWEVFAGAMPMNGNYLLMQENLSDLSHLPFLHATVFNVPEAVASLQIELEVNKETAAFRFWRSSRVWDTIKGFFPPSFNYDDRQIETSGGGFCEMPGFFHGTRVLNILDAQPDETARFTMYFDHFMTPETLKKTHYYYAVGRDVPTQDPDYSERIKEVIKEGFIQDAVAVERMQNLLDNDQHDFRELMIAGDKPSMAMRNLIITLVEKEYGAKHHQ